MNGMPTPPNDDTKTLFKLLADNEWHQYEEIRDAIARSVPPGRALRRYEDRLANSRKQHETRVGLPPLTETEKIYYGARACGQVAISSWTGRGVIRKTEAGMKFIRIKPGFQPWGVGSAVRGDAASGVAGSSASESSGGTDLPSGDSGGSTGRPTELEEPSPEEPALAEPTPAELAPLASERVEASVLDEPVSEAYERAAEPDAPAAAEQAPPAAEGAEQGPEPAVPGVEVPQGVDEPLELDDAEYVPLYAQGPSLNVTTTECKECGLEIIDEQVHTAWHQDQKAAQKAAALKGVDEVTLRTLIKEEIGTNLDNFQSGMQEYLEGMFMQLEVRFAAAAVRISSGSRWTDREGRPRL